LRCPDGYAIAVSNLVKKYGEIEAVRGISFRVNAARSSAF
jgi:ABC-type multidrug transport system ATPase subunit